MIPYPPMLAVSWAEPFDDPDWWFEVKWDGVRVIVETGGAGTRLWSRTGKDMSAYYPELHAVGSGRTLVLDGEIVALDESGIPSFNRLQQRMNRLPRRHESVAVGMVVFDILDDGEPLIDLPFETRREKLEAIDPGPATVSSVVPGEGIAVFEAASEGGLEGVVAKRAGSRYQPGRRSPDWRKIPLRRRISAVVGGFTFGEGNRSGGFGALQMGLWDGGRLRYIGGVGTGFDAESVVAIRRALDEIRQEPADLAGDWPRATMFVAPVLVGLVDFQNWTPGGRMRGPSFAGFSTEPSETCTWETEGAGA